MAKISYYTSLERDLLDAAYKAGGATKTIAARQGTARDFAAWCKTENLQYKSVANIKAKAVGRYIESLKAGGISRRTAQNRMAHLRAMLQARDSANKIPSNQQLGIDGASRAGVRTAMTAQTYQEARAQLIGAGKLASAACLALQRELGLCSGEAVQAGRSLRTWEKQLENGQARVSVRYGARRGRPRETTPTSRERALAAIHEAQAVMKSQGRDGRIMRGGTLQAARSAYQRDCRAVGLLGAQAPHSARYAYAQERYRAYVAQGYEPREAKSAVAQDLGSSPNRDRAIQQVYLRRSAGG